MQLTSRTIPSKWGLDALLMGLLAVVLLIFAAGCGVLGGDGGGLSAPAGPSGLTTTATDASVDLEWSAVQDADSYNVYRATSPTNGASGNALETGVSQASYTDQTVQNGTTYYYRVTAVVSSNGNTAESDGSAEAEATPFASPSGLAGTSRDSEVELTWGAASGAASYNVYRDTSSTGGGQGNPLATGVSQANYTDQSAQNGTKYYYRVTSVNPNDLESSASNEVAKTPFAEPNRP